MLSLLLTKCWRNSSRTRLNGSVKWHNFGFSYALKYGHCYFFLDLLDKDIDGVGGPIRQPGILRLLS